MDELSERAAAIGRDHGKNAGSWVFDGNTTAETYRYVLKGIEEGDPVIMDAYREPSLSGADDYGSPELAAELGLGVLDLAMSEAEEAYCAAASGAFWDEVERAARYQVG